MSTGERISDLLGHRNVSTTQKYIGVNYATAREAVEAMALDAKTTCQKLQNVKLTKTKRATELLSRPFCERKILYMKTLA